MCGIIGGNKKELHYQEAVKALKHRGPDDQGIVHRSQFSLGFTRLAVIDLSPQANQPMSSVDDSVCITFNGEIYGFQKLRTELEHSGHKFKTQSDTEVLLNAYLQWNEDFTKHFDGMFAIAIHDAREGKVKLFRDRSGIKPLYYFYDKEIFAFSSELKGITALCPREKFTYDYTALIDYLTYSYIPSPKTLYKNTFKLKAAHKLIYDISSHLILENKPYWAIARFNNSKYTTIAQAAEKFKELLNLTLKEQIVADVPVGFFLSGGMDSSCVVAESSKLSNQTHTFTIGFDKNNFSELPYAKKIADQFNTVHHEKNLSLSASRELLPRMKSWYDEPFADTSALPTYLLSEFTRNNVTVALSGDGGDEIFGGYQRYARMRSYLPVSFLQNKTGRAFFETLKIKFKYTSLVYRIFNYLEFLSSDFITRFAMISGRPSKADLRKYFHQWDIPDDYDHLWHYKEYDRKDLPPMTRLQYIDFHTYLPDDILTKVDRASMAVSLEVRVPLLAQRIIEFMFSLPEELRFYKNENKGMLKEAYKSVFPADIINRPKKGFSVPGHYINKDRNFIQETILTNVFGIA